MYEYRKFAQGLRLVVLVLGCILGFATVVVSASAAASEVSGSDIASGPSASDYDRAFQLQDSNLAALVRNAEINPHWLKGGESFWYSRQATDGFEYIRVTSATGEREPLFDHPALSAAISSLMKATEMEATGKLSKGGPNTLILELTHYDDDAQSITGQLQGKTVFCTLSEPVCEIRKAAAPQPGMLFSPDGKRSVFIRDHNLWLRDELKGEERPLTNDGVAGYSWSKTPDNSLAAIPEQRNAVIKLPHATFWSPDGSHLVTTRVDEREMGIYPFVEWVPLDDSVRPKLYQLRIPLVGDPLPVLETHVVNLKTGKQAQIDAGAGFQIAPGGLIGWDVTGSRVFMLAQNYGSSAVRLIEVVDGQSRVVYEETSPTSVRLNIAIYNDPNVRLLSGGRVLWFSERTGWGHLYLIDTDTGQVLKALTSGDWNVFDVLQVDEKNKQVYFTGGGREAGDPYQRRLYRVGLDGTDLSLLTPEEADHQFAGAPSFLVQMVFGFPAPSPRISPDGQYAVAAYSTLQDPPTTVLRSTIDGSVVATLGHADVSGLNQSGYRPPERISALAADGKTRVWGAIYYPTDFDPSRQYPVINALYAGPQVTTAPVNYLDAILGFGQANRAALASLGFIVVTIDGRGTPYRSRAFQDVSRGVGHGTETLKDHRAALEQLAASRPYMDLTRVGVWGHSWGGYHAARAIFQHNDFYDAAVASAGIHGFHWSYPGFESFIGVPDYGNDSHLRSSSSDVPDMLRQISNTELVAGLQKGHLLIAYGDLDENVQPSQAAQLINALINADRNFDVLYLPNRTHYYNSEPYFQRRLWDYFVEHVIGVEPPHYSISRPQVTGQEEGE